MGAEALDLFPGVRRKDVKPNRTVAPDPNLPVPHLRIVKSIETQKSPLIRLHRWATADGDREAAIASFISVVVPGVNPLEAIRYAACFLYYGARATFKKPSPLE